MAVRPVQSKVVQGLKSCTQGSDTVLYRPHHLAGNVYRPHVDGAWPGSGVDQVTGQQGTFVIT
jgi:hypothetical protein